MEVDRASQEADRFFPFPRCLQSPRCKRYVLILCTFSTAFLMLPTIVGSAATRLSDADMQRYLKSDRTELALLNSP